MLHKTFLIFSCFIACCGFAQPNQKQADSLKNVLLQHTTRDTSRVLTLIKYANVLFYIQPDSSIMKYADEALQIAEEVKWNLGIANSLQVKAVVYDFFWADPVKALDCYQKALKINESVGNKGFQLTVLVDIGVIHFNLNEYEQALRYFNQAYAIMQQQRVRKGEDQLLMNMGNAYNGLKQNTQAEEFYTKSIALAEKSADMQVVANALCSRGLVYRNQSKLKQAINDLEQGLALAEKYGLESILTVGLINLAETCIDLKEYNAAEKYAQRAVQLSRKINMRQLEGQAIGTLADLYKANGNMKKALAYYSLYQPMHDSLLSDETKQSLARMEMQYQFNKTQDSIKAVTDKQQALAKAKIQKQHVIEIAMIAGAGFLILAGIGSFIFYKRNRDIRTQKNEVELKSQITETEMKALRAQMNPHFIFNSLNSINDYINKHDTETATMFTTKFAKLMRRILENSEQKEILLSNELQTLELYMQLEAMRLQKGFSYEIKIDENIDKDNTLIPPMLLQPFLENSILHGIAKKQGGKIMLHIQKEGDMLNCIVEDNGSGIQPDTDIKEKDTERKSFGTRITQDRINIINRLKKTNGKVELKNLIQGTRTEVTLPFETAY